jgi:hypothetical protein
VAGEKNKIIEKKKGVWNGKQVSTRSADMLMFAGLSCEVIVFCLRDGNFFLIEYSSLESGVQSF